MKKWSGIGVTLAVVMGILSGCGNAQTTNNAAAQNTDPTATTEVAAADPANAGGKLDVGYPTQPVTLDAQISSNTAVKDISREIYEQLVTLDENAQVTPMLAESYEVSEDRLTYTFKLREGVKFHNGKELKAEDAVASLNRWIQISTPGKTNFQGAVAEQTDDYTVVLKLKTPFLLALQLLADPIPSASIYPKEVVEAAGEDGINEYIGTGPFKLAEWKQDQYIHLEKYDDYAPRSEPSSGAGGKKEALVDDLFFHFVTDESTRLAGIASGEYDIALNISVDNSEQISGNPDLQEFLSPGGLIGYFYNSNEGLFQNEKARQAVNAALNDDEILLSTFRDERFYTKTSSLVLEQFPDWYSEAGQENYNQNDSEKAKKLLEEAGYNGEEIVIYTTRDYIDQYNVAVVLQQQLEAIGVKVKLDVYDWATLQEKLAGSGWDIYPMSYAFRPTFYQYSFWGGAAGFLKSDKLDGLLQDIRIAESPEAARSAIDGVQEFVWTEVPFSQIGQSKQITALSKDVAGFQNILGPIFFNVTNSEQ